MESLPRDVLARVVRHVLGDPAHTLPSTLSGIARSGVPSRAWLVAVWDGVDALRLSFAPRGASDGAGWLYVAAGAASEDAVSSRLASLAARANPSRLCSIALDYGGACGREWAALWALSCDFLRDLKTKAEAVGAVGVVRVELRASSPSVLHGADGDVECAALPLPPGVRSLVLAGGCAPLAARLAHSGAAVRLDALAVEWTRAAAAALVPPPPQLTALSSLEVTWHPTAAPPHTLEALGGALGGTLTSLAVNLAYEAGEYAQGPVTEGLVGLLRGCRRLTRLALAMPVADDALVLAVAGLGAQLGGVERFALCVSRSEEADMSDFVLAELVAAMPRLAHVTLQFAYVSDCVCRALAALPGLRRARIAGSLELTGQALDELAAAPPTAEFAIALGGDTVDLANRPNRGPLARIVVLEYAHVEVPRDTQASVARLAPRCPDLRELRFVNSALPAAPDVLPRALALCDKLKSVVVAGVHWTGVPTGTLRALAALPHLRTVALSGDRAAAVATERADEIGALRAAGKHVTVG